MHFHTVLVDLLIFDVFQYDVPSSNMLLRECQVWLVLNA
jgi:hypothetical protein